MKKSFQLITFIFFIFLSNVLIAFPKDNEKLKLIVNRSFNEFQNLFVIDENTIASLGLNKEIWDIKNKRLTESTSYIEKYRDVYGVPGVDSNVSNYPYNSEYEYCHPTFDLKNGGRLNCEQVSNVISPLPPEEDKNKKEIPRNINNLNISNNILKDYDLDIKVKEDGLEIKRNYSNILKIFDKLSNKYQRIWADNIYWTDNRYFILEKNILKAYSLNSLSLEKEFKVLNNLENVYEYENKLIIKYKNKVDIVDFKSGKVLYSIKDDTKNISSKHIITGGKKLIITYKINNFTKDNYYDSSDKIYTKIFNINNGKFLSKIEIKAYGGYFGILDAKIKIPYLIGRMGPARNWIDVWNVNNGKIKHIIIPIGSTQTFNVYDGKIILGTRYSNFEIYDITSGKLIKSIEKDINSNKEDLRFSSEIIKTIIYKNQIISSYLDNTIKILDLNTGKLLKVLSSHKKEINDIYLEKDVLVSIDKSGLINTWDLKSRKIVNTNQTQTTGVLKVYNSRIFVKGQEEVIDIVDTKTQKIIKTIKNYDSPITSVVKDNNTIYAGTTSGDIYVIDYLKGKVEKTLKGLDNTKISFILRDDKNNLIYGSNKGDLVVFSIIKQIKSNISLEKYIINAYIHKDKLFVELSESNYFFDKKLIIIDYLSEKLNLHEISDYSTSITFFKEKIYYISEDQSLKELNLNTYGSKDIVSSAIGIEKILGDLININVEYLFNDNLLISIVKDRKYTNNLILDILDLKNYQIKKINDVQKSDLILISYYIFNKKLYLYKYNYKYEYFIETIDLEQGKLLNRKKLENFNFNVNREIDEGIKQKFIKNKIFFVKDNLINRDSELSFFNIDDFSYLKTIKEYLVHYEDEVIVTQKNNTINIWDINTLNKIDSIKIEDKEIALFFQDNKLVTKKDNQISIYDMRIYKKVLSFLDKDASNYLKIIHLDDENLIYNTSNNDFKFINLKSKQITKLINANNFEKIDDNYFSFNTFDNSNNYIYNIYDMKNRKILFKTKNDYYYDNLLYSSKNKLLLQTSGNIVVKNLTTNETIKEFKNYHFVLPLKSFYNTDKLILRNKYGNIEIWDINTLKLLSTYYVLKSVTFMITPEGYFSGTGDYQNYFYFKSESGEYINLDDLKEFNRPDLVKKSLDGENLDTYPNMNYEN
jgi:hypothetical protein